MASLDLVVDVAKEQHASVVERRRDEVLLRVRPPLPSGSPGPEYVIRVKSGKGVLTAREALPDILPAFCPERHINVDGTFCLHWAEEEPLTVSTVDGAEEWWSKLLVFLDRQRLARRLRRWPGQADARAHGPGAARHQATAERLAAMLGDRFASGLRESRFDVSRKGRSGEGRLRLTLDGRRVCSVLEAPRKVMTLRSPCVCDGPGRRLQLRKCPGHAEALAGFVVALHGQRREEKRFFDAMRSQKRTCCGSMANCELAR